MKRAQRWALGLLLPAATAVLNCRAADTATHPANKLAAEIAAALDDYPRFEPRFAGFNPAKCAAEAEHAPLVPRRQCGSPPVTNSRTFERLARLSPRVKEVGGSSAPDALRIRAIWSLLWSDESAVTAQAVADLRRARRLAPNSAVIANDLVAALIALAQRTQSPRALVDGLDHALRADSEGLESDALEENRNLARTLLRLPPPPQLTAISDQPRKPAPQDKPSEAAARTAMIGEFARVFGRRVAGLEVEDVARLPEVARDTVFRQVLSLGVGAQTMASVDPTRHVLPLAGAVARQIHLSSGDASLLTTVGELQSATGECRSQLWQAHELMGSGMAAFDGLEVEKSALSLRRAIPLFSCSDSPAPSWAQLWLAGSLLYGSEKAEAARLFRLVEADGQRFNSPSLSGRALWGQGTIAFLAAKPAEAADFYQKALQLFEGIAERRNAGAVARLLDGVLDEAGFFEAAWKVRLRALGLLESLNDPEWFTTAWVGASRAARRDGFYRAAREFADQAVWQARLSRDPLSITTSLLEMAQVSSANGDTAAASMQLDSARRESALVVSPTLRDRLHAELMLALHEVGSAVPTEHSPLEELDHALRVFQEQRNWDALSRLQFLHGRRAAASRDFDVARAAFVAAASLLQRAVAQNPNPISDHYLEEHSDLLHELLETELHRSQGFDSVLAVAELLGGSAMDGDTASSVMLPGEAEDYAQHLITQTARSLVSGECVVRFLAARSHLASWLIKPDGAVARVNAIASSELRRAVDDFVDLLETNGPEPAILRSGTDLAGQILAPLQPELDQCRDLLIVPDSVLAGLPFAALPSSPGGAALITRASVRFAPSLAARLRKVPQPAAMPSLGAERLLLLYQGNPVDHSTSSLPAVQTEIARLGSLYRYTRLLDMTAHDFSVPVSEKPQIVHYAGHSSRTLQPNPLVAWAGPFAPERESRPLPRFEEIVALQPRVVVLAGCETGIGPTGHWIGTLGMGKQLVAAGIPESVLTYWRIRDTDAARVAEELHKSLSRGGSAVNALRTAQLALLGHPPGAGASTPSSSWAAFFVVVDR